VAPPDFLGILGIPSIHFTTEGQGEIAVVGRPRDARETFVIPLKRCSP
jgi:hypothetical protein